MSSGDQVRIGISRCLLGDEVRWDGGHKRDRFLVETFGHYVEWVPVCPEVESGLPVPRETMRLEASPEGGTTVNGRLVRLVFPKSGGDWTDEMAGWAGARVRALARDDLDGFILKSNSPSCGMERVRIYQPGRPAEKKGRGVFAEALMSQLPHLPVEEEGRLSDPRLRENFIERVFAYRRLKALFAGRWGVGDLVRFHTAHKLTLLAHKPAAYRALGRLVAEAKGTPREQLRTQYVEGFMTAMAAPATPAKHANVLQHMLGHLRGRLDAEDRAEVLELIEDHRRGLVPLIVPVTLLRHHVRRLGVAYLEGQTYLDPHPRELALRNHV
ncbi:MAG: YbgA family protein [Vicinamibacterales bacterium]